MQGKATQMQEMERDSRDGGGMRRGRGDDDRREEVIQQPSRL